MDNRLKVWDVRPGDILWWEPRSAIKEPRQVLYRKPAADGKRALIAPARNSNGDWYGRKEVTWSSLYKMAGVGEKIGSYSYRPN